MKDTRTIEISAESLIGLLVASEQFVEGREHRGIGGAALPEIRAAIAETREALFGEDEELKEVSR